MDDVENNTFQEEVLEQLPEESQNSWYGVDARKRWTDHIRKLLHDPKPFEEPPMISLEGTEVDPGSGSFAVLPIIS